MELGGILDALRGADIRWIAAAVLLHVLGQAARGVAWHAVLVLSFGSRTGGRGEVAACHVAGAGAGGLLSSRGGDVMRVLLVRRRVAGASLPALAGTLVIEGLFETTFGLALGVWAASRGLGADGSASVVAVAVAGAATATFVLVALRTGRPAWLVRQLIEVGKGLASVRQPRRLVTHVLPWQLLGRAARAAAIGCFLLAFGLPFGIAAIACVMVAHGGGQLLPLPGVGAAAGAGLLVASFATLSESSADPSAVAALAVAMPGALTLVGLAVSLALVAALSGRGSLEHSLSRLRTDRVAVPEVIAPRPARPT